MNTNRTLIIAVIAAITLCAALVWSNVAAVGRARDLKVQLDAKEAELQQQLATSKPNSPTVDTGWGDILARREAEYAQLREEYEKLKDRIASNAVPSMVSTNASVDRRRGGPGGNNAWLERLRLQDPERYKQMIVAREERRKQADQQYQEQLNQLDQRIQTAPTQPEVDLASQIADTLDRLTQLRQQREALASLPADQQQAQAQDLAAQTRQAFQDLSQLRDQDRTLQYQQLADQLGLKGEDAQTLVQSIPQILQKTQYSPQRGQGGPGGFGGFGGFGGGGPGGNAGGGATQPSTTSSPTTK
jgi:hypothetical protein